MNAALFYHLLRCHLESLFVRMHQSSFLGDWDFCCVLWTDEGWRNGRLAFNTLIIQSVSDMNWWINSGILTDLFVSGHEWIILSKTVRSVPVLPRSVPGNQPTSIQLPALVNNDLFTMTSAVQCEIAILLWNHIDELFLPIRCINDFFLKIVHDITVAVKLKYFFCVCVQFRSQWQFVKIIEKIKINQSMEYFCFCWISIPLLSYIIIFFIAKFRIVSNLLIFLEYFHPVLNNPLKAERFLKNVYFNLQYFFCCVFLVIFFPKAV